MRPHPRKEANKIQDIRREIRARLDLLEDPDRYGLSGDDEHRIAAEIGELYEAPRAARA